MAITYHDEMVQGSEDWHAARCGLLTASEMKLIVTPKLQMASNEKERAHLFELMAQRVTRYVEPRYISDDMLRGRDDEFYARAAYSEKYAPVVECGFVTNDEWGFTIGYSPDGRVGETGGIECKSRRQKYQMQTIIENVVPEDFVMQVQTGLLVTKWEWLDFVSYSGGLPMAVIRAYPDDKVQAAILEASAGFEDRLSAKLAIFKKNSVGLLPTERRVEEEMYA